MKRQRAERRGRVAEWAAMLYLMCKGYRILGHRLRTPYGEVDLAAWKDGVLVIVEVKARNTYDAGAYAPTAREIVTTLQTAFAHDAVLWRHWRKNLRLLARPQAARTIAAHVLAAATPSPSRPRWTSETAATSHPSAARNVATCFLAMSP